MTFRTSKSPKSKSVKSKSAKNRLSVSLEDNDHHSEEEISVFGEDDIILVEYEDTQNTPLKKGNKSTKKNGQGQSQKNQSDAFDFLDIDTDDDDLKVAEAIVIDFDTPTRKLLMSSRVNLKKINLKKINMKQQLQLEESSCRRRKLKLKRQAEEEEDDDDDKDEEEEDDEVSSNIASLMAKRSKLSHKLANQRKISNKRIRTL